VDTAQRSSVSSPPPPREKIGQFSVNAEKTAASANCTSQKPATLTASGPGYETFMVACPDGESLAVRCDFGNCRALK
jgi:hypothetical protein